MLVASLRAVSGQEGGLCGLAAMYQALSSTVLTRSQLTKHDYTSMKKHLLEMAANFSSYAYSDYSGWEKAAQKDDRLLLHKIYKVVCEERQYIPLPTRRRRSPAVSAPNLQSESKRLLSAEWQGCGDHDLHCGQGGAGGAGGRVRGVAAAAELRLQAGLPVRPRQAV